MPVGERVAATGSGRYRFRPGDAGCGGGRARSGSGPGRQERGTDFWRGIVQRRDQDWRTLTPLAAGPGCVNASRLAVAARGGEFPDRTRRFACRHDSGAATVAAGSGERRYGPPESVRERDAQLEAAVPTRYTPPAGMCRVWVGGVPPERQPAPTECAKAIRVRSPNSHVVFGKPRPAALDGPGEGNPGGVSVGGHDNVAASDHLPPQSDGHTTGSVAPVHPAAGGEPGPVVPSGTNAPKTAPATGPSASHLSPPHAHASSPPKVATRPRR